MNTLRLALGSTAIALLVSCATAPESAPTPVPAPAPAPAPQQAAPTPTAPAAPVAAPKRCDAAVTFRDRETFAFDRFNLTSAAKARLDVDVMGQIATCASVTAIVIEGHADRIGSQQYNQKLSERRADSVKTYLVDKGVDRTKIDTMGMGKTLPAKFCPDVKKRTELIACLAPNRRAVIAIKGPGK